MAQDCISKDVPHIITSSPIRLVNFCLAPLVELISTSVSADNYPTTNLVSTDAVARSRGYRVEHFIRPPVQLDFEFQLPLNIACIIIQPELAPSAEMKLEITGSFHTASTTTNLQNLCPGTVVHGNQTALVLENKTFKFADRRNVSDILQWPVEGSFLSGGGSGSLNGVQLVRLPLKHGNILEKLRQLRITVNRISGPKPVSLKSMEVWGIPSNSCSAFQLNLLQTSLTAVQQQKQRQRSSSSGSSEVRLYSSYRSIPQQGPVGHEHQSTAVNDLHRNNVLGCSDACYWKTGCSDRDGSHSAHPGVPQTKEKCQSATSKFGEKTMLGVANSGGAGLQEVSHIKAQTSENKKSLKPQQRAATSHFAGCSRNIQNDKKPSPTTDFNDPLPQGKNGNPSSVSQLTHNSSKVNDEENLIGSSCGLQSNTAATNQQQQQQSRQAQCTFIEREIPTEFLDKITYEIMRVPMLLPSGHCVDRDTLEKLSNIDALYGRPPTDPFTGMPFSGVCRPEFCPQLKLKLDQYLSSSSPSAATRSGRTVGSAGEIAVHLRRLQDGPGNRKRCRDEAAETYSVKEPRRKKPQSLAEKDTSYAALESSISQRAGFGQAWAIPSTQRSSYQRGSEGATKKDQSSQDRILGHDAQPPEDHNLKGDNKSKFEQEVAGSLDQALKQILSDS